MINNYLRGLIHPNDKDVKQIIELIKNINSAIHAIPNTENRILFRGYTNPNRILELKRGEFFIEDAFVSSTESKDVAVYYATKNQDVTTPVISMCQYNSTIPMIYFDEDEEEWLLPPKLEFKVTSINNLKMRDEKGKIRNGKLFKLKRIIT